MRRGRFLRQKTDGKLCAQAGQVHWFLGMYFVLLLILLVATGLQIKQYEVTSGYMEDALAASNLASAVIDLEEYGRSHVLRIADPVLAYGRYCQALRGNLNLDETWQCRNGELIASPVLVVRYIVYNVSEEAVYISEIKEGGRVYESTGSVGTVRAPNGILIEHTAVYSEIACTVKGMWNTEVKAEKGKLIDIVAEGNEI